MKKYTEKNLISIIKASVLLSNQKKVAANLKISPQYLSDILSERRCISEQVAKKLKFKRVVYFIDMEQK